MKLSDFTMLKPSTGRDKTRTVTPMLQAWFQQFADFCAFRKLTIHCGLCRVDAGNQKRAWQHWGECSGFAPSPNAAGGSTLIKTPGGSIWLGLRPQREELRAEQIEWLRQAADVLPHFKLGLHCQRCDADLAAKNADADSVYSVACRCTEYIGPNRDMVKVVVH